MNKYKIVSLVLAFALLATLVRLVYVSQSEGQPAAAESKASVVFQNILNRKSVRAYTDRKITREQLDTLLRAAMAAPTGRDMRPWKFVVIDDTAALSALAGQLPYAKMLPQAAAAVVVCGDLSVTDDQLGLRLLGSHREPAAGGRGHGTGSRVDRRVPLRRARAGREPGPGPARTHRAAQPHTHRLS